MSRGVRLSKKHGVNPCLGVCFLCGEDSGEIGLLGLLPGDKEAPRQAVLSREPCSKCKGFMEQGVILIATVKDGESGGTLSRTGGFAVVKDAAIADLISDEAVRRDVLRRRVAFVSESAWRALGLDRDVPAQETPNPEVRS